MAQNATFSKKQHIERLREVIKSMQQLHKTQWLITQANIRKQLSAKNPTDTKSVERAVNDLISLGIIKRAEENNCLHCGRPLGKGPFYSLTGLVPIAVSSGIQTFGPGFTQPPIEEKEIKNSLVRIAENRSAEGDLKITEEAGRILTEAGALAEKRIRKKFPEDSKESRPAK